MHGLVLRGKTKQKKRIRVTVLALALIGSLFCLSACEKTETLDDTEEVETEGETESGTSGGSRNAVFTVGGEDCSVEEAKVILLQFQKDSTNQYGIDMWKNENVDRTNLVQYIKNSAVNQLAQVLTLDAAAEGLGIELTEAESTSAAEAAQAYLNALSDAESKYLEINERTAQQLFERYLLAQRAYDYITRNVPTEISDSEALVMDVRQIAVSDEVTARAILERARDGEDFGTLASRYSQDSETMLYVTRTTFDSDEMYYELAALEEGECTDVIEYDGMYRIYYCETYFDEERTEENRAEVLEQRRSDAVDELCRTYADPEDAVLRNSVWGKVEVDTTLELAGPSFREVFEAYFPS